MAADPLRKIALLLVFALLGVTLSARDKDGVQYGAGLVVNVPYPAPQVEQVVQDVAQNGIIRGTKEYNKDEYVKGAAAVSSTRVFSSWAEGGKVFYKVREHALDPRNFKDSGDMGTLAVRYVVQAQGENNCVLHIDAAFVEDFRRNVHPSNGSVESAEYKDIHDRLEATASMKAEAAEAERVKQEQVTRKFSSSIAPGETSAVNPTAMHTEPSPPAQLSVSPAVSEPASAKDSSAVETPSTAPETATPSPQDLESRVKDLRRQVERLVKPPGAALRSAPFHSASALKSLPGGTDVLIVISTPYWYGVETHEGQRGWIMRDDLELLP